MLGGVFHTAGFLHGLSPALLEVTIIERPEPPVRWVFLVGAVVLALVGLVRSLGPVQHQLAILSAFKNVKNQFEQMDRGFGINPVLLLQIFISCTIIGLSVFLFQPVELSFTLVDGFRLYLLLLMAVCLAYAFKYFIHYITGLVLQSEVLGNLMVIGSGQLMYAYTLLAFPMVMAWYYVPSMEMKFYLEIALLSSLVIFLVWRLLKSIFIYNRYFPFAKIYIIFYLCTLEITPLLILGYYIVLSGGVK